jgi:hypothetical protein
MKQALCGEAPANRRQLAETVTATYPVLAHAMQTEMNNRSPYHLRMFEAVALGIVCYEQLEALEKRQNN